MTIGRELVDLAKDLLGYARGEIEELPEEVANDLASDLNDSFPITSIDFSSSSGWAEYSRLAALGQVPTVAGDIPISGGPNRITFNVGPVGVNSPPGVLVVYGPDENWNYGVRMFPVGGMSTSTYTLVFGSELNNVLVPSIMYIVLPSNIMPQIPGVEFPPAISLALDLSIYTMGAYRVSHHEVFSTPIVECFPAHTAILTSLTSSTAISALRVDDFVLSFDQRADHGRGALTPRRIKRLYRNTTTEWVVLRWVEAGQARELTLTPGHHVLDQYGQFPTIEAMLRDGVATVVLASGELAQVTAERIVYSAATAHLYERAQSVGISAGNAALQPVLMDAWQTYNFEVEDLHTYVAGGVRVHNDSGLLGWIGNQTNNAIDTGLGIREGSIGDLATDILTSPLHFVGEILDLGVRGIDAFARGVLWVADQLGVGITDPNWTRVVGPGSMPGTLEIAHARGPHTMIYDENSPFSGQRVQAGGDADEDGQLEPGDKFLHDAGIYDRQAEEARANGNPLQAQYYEDRAARARAQAAALQSPDNGSDDDDDGGISQEAQDAINDIVEEVVANGPILLDLDGNGIKVTDLSRSTQFVVGDDGLEHRTAWAGQGDGVLFYDADGDGKISEKREYVFTEWDPTARSDFEALRARFDSNNDGKLTSADAEFSKFKVMVTKADGTIEAQTLTQLGISEIDLTGDTTEFRLPDGSVITGQGTFTMNGVERTAADVTLMAEGYRVVTESQINFPDEATSSDYDEAVFKTRCEWRIAA